MNGSPTNHSRKGVCPRVAATPPPQDRSVRGGIPRPRPSHRGAKAVGVRARRSVSERGCERAALAWGGRRDAPTRDRQSRRCAASVATAQYGTREENTHVDKALGNYNTMIHRTILNMRICFARRACYLVPTLRVPRGEWGLHYIRCSSLEDSQWALLSAPMVRGGTPLLGFRIDASRG